MAMYSFLSPFREAKFCGVPSCVFDELGCATGEKRLQNTALMQLTDAVSYTSNGIMGLHDTVLATGKHQASVYWTTLVSNKQSKWKKGNFWTLNHGI
jgi:hypothetical protein